MVTRPHRQETILGSVDSYTDPTSGERVSACIEWLISMKICNNDSEIMRAAQNALVNRLISTFSS